MRVLIVLAMGVLVVLAGCATPYQPQGSLGGFSVTPRGDDFYVVRFEGNGYTRAADAEDMAMLRAAELTLERGYTYFAVLSEDTRIASTTFTTPSHSTTRGSVDSSGNFRARTSTFGGNAMNITWPNARLLVWLAKDRALPGHHWIDAQSLVKELGPKYKAK